jgi:hypothetical protein
MQATNITDDLFLKSLSLLNVPDYIRIQRYSQFCIESHRIPNWPLFHAYFPKPKWRTP